MSIPQHLVNQILVKCGRHCCICRRFEPLHLQVHHIVERAGGGTDSLDNLIALCLTCHSDVHTKTKMSRRFTPQELKEHRDLTFRLVAERKLPTGDVGQDRIDTVLSAVLQALGSPSNQYSSPRIQSETDSLPPAAIRVLVEAARSPYGMVLLVRSSNGMALQINGKQLCERGNPRSEAEYKDAVDRLLDFQLLESPGYEGEVFRVTHRGYIFADQILAAGMGNM